MFSRDEISIQKKKKGSNFKAISRFPYPSKVYSFSSLRWQRSIFAETGNFDWLWTSRSIISHRCSRCVSKGNYSAEHWLRLRSITYCTAIQVVVIVISLMFPLLDFYFVVYIMNIYCENHLCWMISRRSAVSYNTLGTIKRLLKSLYQDLS